MKVVDARFVLHLTDFRFVGHHDTGCAGEEFPAGLWSTVRSLLPLPALEHSQREYFACANEAGVITPQPKCLNDFPLVFRLCLRLVGLVYARICFDCSVHHMKT